MAFGPSDHGPIALVCVWSGNSVREPSLQGGTTANFVLVTFDAMKRRKGGSNNDQEEPCSSDGGRNRICGMLGARECAAVELRGDGRTDLFTCRRNATVGWHPGGQLFVTARGTPGGTPHRPAPSTKPCL